MPLDLSSVKGRLARAEEHFAAYRAELQPWIQSKPYTFIAERNKNATYWGIALQVTIPPPIQRWSLVISDCIHNLRAALDNLVYAIAVHEGVAPPHSSAKGDKFAFPICDDGPKFKQSIGRIKKLSTPVRTAIEAAQPYNRPNPAVPPFLAILRDFDNRNKHELLRLAFASLFDMEVSFSTPSALDCGKARIAPNYGELEHDAKICGWIFKRPCPDVQIDEPKVEIGLAFWHAKLDPSDPAPTDRSEASALVREITKEVNFVIDSVVAKVR